jgi:hypothetical protein
MKKWEYLERLTYLSDTELARLGAEGWELVTYEHNGAISRYMFKREIPEESRYCNCHVVPMVKCPVHGFNR